jgi:hypothetical protein
MNTLDRTDPPLYTILSDGTQVRLIRIDEKFETEQVVFPFEQQVIRSESIPVGEKRLSQPGVNGVQEITRRLVYEDGEEVSNNIVTNRIIVEAIPEITLIGAQSPYVTIPIAGKLAYLSGGNAWIMEATTGNRRPLVSTGDLDGQIFSLSPDGNWLVFTRKSDNTSDINSLWAIQTDADAESLIDIAASNIIHFAEWSPLISVIGYSTVEPRSTAPGWQANNDLLISGVSSSGFIMEPRIEIESNSGGVYGWWGTNYAWAPDGIRLIYARPDQVGIYNTADDITFPLVEILPLQTNSDWAWIPGVSWAPDETFIYLVDHIYPPGAASPEESPHFDLVAIPLDGGAPIHLVSDVGMFAYPTPSVMSPRIGVPAEVDESTQSENNYYIAYLQAIYPEQSESSAYRLVVMDRDGSNRRALFPSEGSIALEPQKIIWSPLSVDEDQGKLQLAVIYQGDIWIVNVEDSSNQQITGDGMISRIDWK